MPQNPLNVVKKNFFVVHSISDKQHKNKYRSGCLLYIKLDHDFREVHGCSKIIQYVSCVLKHQAE